VEFTIPRVVAAGRRCYRAVSVSPIITDREAMPMSTDDRVRTVCTDCNKALLVKSHLIGQWVTCPSCSVTFQAEAADPPPKPAPVRGRPADDDREDDEDRRRPRRPAREDDEDDRGRRRRPLRDEDEEDDRRPRRRRGRDDYEDEEDDRSSEPRPGQCPKCGSRRSTKVSFTWWGGVLGPSLFSMVQCHRCSTQYNSKTGKPVGGVQILTYSLVSLAIVVGILVLIRML
jgi:hypothetical protein